VLLTGDSMKRWASVVLVAARGPSTASVVRLECGAQFAILFD